MNENKSINSLKKQLVAAVAMVCVAAVALGSSTYAWFAANNKVTATGMQVQATAEGGIEIAYVDNGTAGDYATTANAGMTSAQTLYPTSTVATASSGSISSNWYHASAAVASAFGAKDGTYEPLTLSAGKDVITNKNYYVEKTFKIRSVSDTKLAKDLKVSGITVTGASDQLDNSLRVAVVSGTNVALYAPCYTVTDGGATSVSYKVATSVASGIATMPTDNNVTALFKNQISSNIVVGDIGAKTNGSDVKVYIWYEGEDTNHFSNNLDSSIDTISLSVEFEATIE